MNAVWLMSVTYRTQNGPNVVEFDLEEIWDAHDIIERGPDWNPDQRMWHTSVTDAKKPKL
jgi:hypothetical protein